jgi:hypothetical protein
VFGVLLVYLLVRKINIEKATYYDGCFYNINIDIDYYFLERLGRKVPQDIQKNELTTNEANLNSSRGLKVNTEINKEGDILVLAENNTNVQGRPSQEVVLQNNNNLTVDMPNTRRKSITVKTGGNRNINTEYKSITNQDYQMIPKHALLQYDLRGYGKYVADELIEHHSVVKLILKNSFLDSKIISWLKLFYRINLVFGLNAFAFTDNLIEKRATYATRVNNYLLT